MNRRVVHPRQYNVADSTFSDDPSLSPHGDVVRTIPSPPTPPAPPAVCSSPTLYPWTRSSTRTTKNYKVICACGPPNAGKTALGRGLAQFFGMVQVTMVSKLYHNYVNEDRNLNILHWSNDEFRSKEEIDFNKMHQSITSVLHATPGYHLVLLEGHRLFENQYTRSSSLPYYNAPIHHSLQSTHCSLCTSCDPVQGHSQKLMQLPPKIAVTKKLVTFMVMKDMGLQQAGKLLSDTVKLKEVAEELQNQGAKTSCDQLFHGNIFFGRKETDVDVSRL